MQLRTLPAMLLVLGLAACGGGGGGGGGTEPVLEVIKWTPSGDNQIDTVGQVLPKVIRVKVTLDGELAEGITVNFSGGTFGTPSVVTGANGIATTTWTLAEVAGPQSVTASVDGAVGSPVTFKATAVPGSPYQLVFAGQESLFVADTGNIFPGGFRAKVADTFGNGIAGRYVRWSRTGPISIAADSIITDTTGVSTLFATAGHFAGAITVVAEVDGLVNSPRTFTGWTIVAPTEVTVASNSFTPDTVIVTAGTAIKWNIVSGSHSITSTGDPSFSSSEPQGAPSSWGPIVFGTPGVYQYECSVHPTQMKGTVIVQ